MPTQQVTIAEMLKKAGYGRGTTCESYIKALKDARFH